MAERLDGIVLRELRVRPIRDATERASWDGSGAQAATCTLGAMDRWVSGMGEAPTMDDIHK